MTIKDKHTEKPAQIIALSRLTLSPLNPRQSVTDDEIAALAESIQTVGLLQNLAGIEAEDGTVAIVALDVDIGSLAAILSRSGIDLTPDSPNAIGRVKRDLFLTVSEEAGFGGHAVVAKDADEARNLVMGGKTTGTPTVLIAGFTTLPEEFDVTDVGAEIAKGLEAERGVAVAHDLSKGCTLITAADGVTLFMIMVANAASERSCYRQSIQAITRGQG